MGFSGCGFLDSRFRENDEELNHLNCNAAVSQFRFACGLALLRSNMGCPREARQASLEQLYSEHLYSEHKDAQR